MLRVRPRTVPAAAGRPVRDSGHITHGGRGSMMAPGEAGGPSGTASERGSVAVFTVMFAVAVVFLTALIVDGGIAMNARQRAADIAEQAARAAAGDIDVAMLRATGTARIAPGACALAGELVQRSAPGARTGVDTVTRAAMGSCQVAGTDMAIVQVTITTRPLIPGILGRFTETARESATAECGITPGAPC